MHRLRYCAEGVEGLPNCGSCNHHASDLEEILEGAATSSGPKATCDDFKDGARQESSTSSSDFFRCWVCCRAANLSPHAIALQYKIEVLSGLQDSGLRASGWPKAPMTAGNQALGATHVALMFTGALCTRSEMQEGPVATEL